MKKIGITILLISAVMQSYAGWPIGKGRSLTALTYDWFRSAKYFDGQGKLQNIGGPNDYFSSGFVSLSYTYGLKRRADFSVSIPFLTQKSISSGTVYERAGFGDVQVGVTFHKENTDYTKSFSVQFLGIIPLYSNADEKLLLGYQSLGAMINFNYSILPKFLKSGYLIFDAGYKQYFASDGPSQFSYTATIGSSIDKFNQLIGSIGGVSSFSINKQFSLLNPSVVKNFTSINATATYGRRITRTFSLYLSGNIIVWGVNTGQGAGIGLSASLRIP
ncbi:MAG: hypothetical protein J0I09_06980 [Sphingobacteriia bacterium]|nr:hypothetical protein [Sphingobacteriia bacterium]